LAERVEGRNKIKTLKRGKRTAAWIGGGGGTSNGNIRGGIHWYTTLGFAYTQKEKKTRASRVPDIKTWRFSTAVRTGVVEKRDESGPAEGGRDIKGGVVCSTKMGNITNEKKRRQGSNESAEVMQEGASVACIGEEEN